MLFLAQGDYADNIIYLHYSLHMSLLRSPALLPTLHSRLAQNGYSY